MDNRKSTAPLFDALVELKQKKPTSLHVPGHKNGHIFSERGSEIYRDILSIDLTEITGLDDLHAPTGVIKEAQQLASNWFGSSQTYFLVGGSTVGNLSMVLATCNANDTVIVQRNCHKSILNGLEISGVKPVFLAPEYEEKVNRLTSPSIKSIKNAIHLYPKAKALILTYPDYFGRTYDIKEMIDYAHQYNIPVLVDEAHGVHFNLSSFFPTSALELGADIVVQSAHKTAPAMTMGSFLHIHPSSLVSNKEIESYLYMLQSSSPSYPIMASLDLTRLFLENYNKENIDNLERSISKFRTMLSNQPYWNILESKKMDDPLKITLQAKEGYTGHQIGRLFEKEYIYPELSTHDQLLFVHGLLPFNDWFRLENAIEKINQQLKNERVHATIERKIDLADSVALLAFSYQEMKTKRTSFVVWERAIGCISAEAVIPYPPGIPIVAKGERITNQHVALISYLIKQGTVFQNQQIQDGITVFAEDEKGE